MSCSTGTSLFNGKGLIANSRHYLAMTNLVIYVIRLNLIRLNPCFLKPALYFIFDRAGDSESNIADHNLTSAKGYPCQYKCIQCGLGILHHTVLYCTVIYRVKYSPKFRTHSVLVLVRIQNFPIQCMWSQFWLCMYSPRKIAPKNNVLQG